MYAAEGSHGQTLIPPTTPSSLRRGDKGDSPVLRAIVGSSSIANFGKGDENQDTFVATCSESGSKCFVGVFDGHGEQGKKISHFARNAMSKSLFSNSDLHTEPVAALEAAYRDTQEKIEREHRHQAELSGTTAVAAYQHRNRLIVANVGDSRAVLGRCESASSSLQAVELSSDQKPSRPDERQRVLAAGGTVDQMSIPVLQRGGVRWIRAGPERVMDKQGMGGLAMSRSLGDLRLHPYVLVLATDGVWDQLTSQEAVDIANKHEDPRIAAREITGISRHRWQIATEGQMSDDITVVVVRLNSEPSASAGGAASPPRTATVSSFFGSGQRLRAREASSRGNMDFRGSPSASSGSGSAQQHGSLRLPECRPRPGSNLGRSRSQGTLGPGSLRPVSTGARLLSTPSNQRGHAHESLPPAGQRSHGLT
eukprot:TRINITY_DN29729_c0_g1_i2.p1 TRINITY_DN29729_c0_g1~~TRINITY_DN29729_c0_g1_i2.p1  ORF type:complete len:442 (-),score=57.29 TRINITY_DN29729_c0_g1_i2:55-1326(-)